jgi:hypothetical protein
MVSTELQFGRLRFQLTDANIQGCKYIIRVRDRYIVGICIHPHYPCFKMKEIYGHDLGFRFANDYRYVLVSQKEQIQRQMESRALQKILQSITGEPTFEYVG